MKKYILLTSLSITSLHSMETVSLLQSTEHSLSLMYNKTRIHLTKEFLSSAANKAEHTIVGSKQQELLSGKFDKSLGTIYQERAVGTIWNQGWSCACLYEKNKDDNSDSDDDTYKPYPYNPEDEKKKLWESTYQETTSNVKNVVEPCINKSDEGFIYYTYRKSSKCLKSNTILLNAITGIPYRCKGEPNCPICKDTSVPLIFTGDKAIEEASKDLSLCYREILRIIAKYYSNADNPNAPYTRPYSPKNTSIVIPALSVEVGFPRDIAAPIAITTIFDFLRDYPEGYDDITLVVKKRSDFTLYKKLLMNITNH